MCSTLPVSLIFPSCVAGGLIKQSLILSIHNWVIWPGFVMALREHFPDVVRDTGEQAHM